MKICVVTGSRAEYGLLRPVMTAIAGSDLLTLQVAVTGTHLEEAHGHTVDLIVADGFTVSAKVPAEMHVDTSVGIARSMGLTTEGFARAFEELQPDLVLVLGDRFEMLAVAQAALVCRLPVAHLCGGDVTEGAWDDAIRHALTKMSHLHFVTNHAAAGRVRQLGERPERVHEVGSPGIDVIRTLPLLDGSELDAELGFTLMTRNVLVTYHPETLAFDDGIARLDELLAALTALGPDVGIVVTMPNADLGGAALAAHIRAWADEHENAAAFMSLGQLRYLSTMAAVDAVVGNSSSGLYEAPSLFVPTVNIGGRQDGRLRASTVIDCPPERDAIEEAIHKAFDLDTIDAVNPYGDGNAAGAIVAVLEGIDDPAALLRKGFVDLEIA
jgi:UDP-hydrolysing UDP-N-acetyl-D-glucosamine 2-epimerase